MIWIPCSAKDALTASATAAYSPPAAPPGWKRATRVQLSPSSSEVSGPDTNEAGGRVRANVG